MKEYISTQKYLLESPRKLRLVVELIKKMKPSEAVEKLPFVQKRAAGDLAKVIKSAIANAKAQGVSDTDLIFKEIQISEGPRLKRGRAASRGMWHPFKKRMAHIRVVLMTNAKSEIKNSKKIEKENVENVKNVEKETKTVDSKKGKEAKS
jgi:large subunit ribosomal protein L22